MTSAASKAALVFVFMAFLAAQAATGFMRDLFAGGVYPRAMRAFDWILETFLIAPLGQTGAALALLGLGAGFAVLILRRDWVDARGPKRDHQSSSSDTGGRQSRDGAMDGKIWMSDLLGNHEIGMKQGTRTKFYGHDWNPASLDLPLSPDPVYAASQRHREGIALARHEFPEAEAVFDAKRFARTCDVFMIGPFYAVRGELAATLRQFDLGDGGLLPITIYHADLTTPLDGEFFLLNFGARKAGFLPEHSGDARKLFVDRETGIQIWQVNGLKPDAEVALSSTVLTGADLWFDPAVYNKFFLCDPLAQALIEIGMGDVFKLKECRVLDNG